jgi:hypothetical protein
MLAPAAFSQWPDEWQEAFQNAALKVWRSAAARQMVAEERWEELRKFSHRAGHNAAIDIIRGRYSNLAADSHAGDTNEGAEPQSPAPLHERPETWVLREDLRQELQALLLELSNLVPELPQSAEHPSRQILGLYLQLLEQELKAADAAEPSEQLDSRHGAAGTLPTSWNHATGTQRPTQEDPLRAEWVRLLVGDDHALPTYREQRLDLQVAALLRPDEIEGEHATEQTQRQAGQWVRTELSRARKRLRTLYEEHYHKTLAW